MHVFRPQRWPQSRPQQQKRRLFSLPPPTSTAVAEVGLEGYQPATQDNHSIFARARVTSGAGTAVLRVRLYEGASPISSELSSSALTTSLADYEMAIADGEAATISDYCDLSIRFYGYDSGGASLTFEVAELKLLVPEGVALVCETVPRYGFVNFQDPGVF